MKINVGIKGKGYCFVELPDLTYDEYMNGPIAHKKVMDAIREKYGNCKVVGYCPAKEVEVLEGK